MTDDLPAVSEKEEIPREEDPKTAASKEEAVFVGRQQTGTTLVIGREDKGEWMKTEDMKPLSAENYR